MKNTSVSLVSFALAVVVPALAQDKIASTNSVSATAAKPAASAGLANDWLRQQSDGFKPWDIGGQVRARFEAKEGMAIQGQAGSLDFRDHGAAVNNEYWLTRSRFHVGYNDQWWSVYGEAQASTANSDLRYAYANNPPVAGTTKKLGYGPEADTLDLHQAFITLGNPKEFPLTVKAGRQELVYGEERLIGPSGWNNIARSFDAAKVRWQNDTFSADVFSGFPVIPENGQFDVDNGQDLFSGIYATLFKIPKTLLDVYFLARNSGTGAAGFAPSPQFPQPSARDIYTLGGRIKSKPGELGHWDYAIEGAYQFGDYRDARAGAPTERLTQDAFMFVVQGGYTFADLWATPRLGLEYSYGSGDRNSSDGTHGTFDNLFPTNHKFYGFMDFASLQNLQDLRGIVQIKPTKASTLALEGHGLWLASTSDNFYTVGGTARGGTGATPGNGYGVNPNYSNFLGTEVDVVGSYAVTKFLQVEAGYGHFFVGKYIGQSLSDSAFGSKDADWFYTQVTFNF